MCNLGLEVVNDPGRYFKPVKRIPNYYSENLWESVKCCIKEEKDLRMSAKQLIEKLNSRNKNVDQLIKIINEKKVQVNEYCNGILDYELKSVENF